jgi:hypothetical protein
LELQRNFLDGSLPDLSPLKQLTSVAGRAGVLRPL